MVMSLLQQATGGQLAQREQVKAGVPTRTTPTLEPNSLGLM